MSVAFASVFACPGTAWFRRLPGGGAADHCAQAGRENLAVEQQSWWRPGRTGAPGYLRSAASSPPPARSMAGCARQPEVQQQPCGLRPGMTSSSPARTAGRRGEAAGERGSGRRVGPGQVRRLSRRRRGAGAQGSWVRFRWSRAVPAARSYRVTWDRAGRCMSPSPSSRHPSLHPAPAAWWALTGVSGECCLVHRRAADRARAVRRAPRRLQHLQRRLSQGQTGF